MDSFETDKSQVRQYRDWLHERNEKQLEILGKVESALEKMESFSRTEKNEHLPIRDGIQEAKKELGALPAARSTPDTRKRVREPTASRRCLRQKTSGEEAQNLQ